MPVSFQGELLEGTFLERPNRFIVWVEVQGQAIKCHCPTSGRIGELTVPGTPMLVRKRPDARPDQATAHSLVAGQHNGTWVVIDTQMVNRLVGHGLEHGTFAAVLPPIETIEPEPATETGRFDFRLATAEGDLLVEAKSVTLLDEEDGVTGRFPDAPTERGTRHVRELTERAREGLGAVVLFVAMREDVGTVAANRATDPGFADALVEAKAAGVDILAWGTSFQAGKLALTDRLPVVLTPGSARSPPGA